MSVVYLYQYSLSDLIEWTNSFWASILLLENMYPADFAITPPSQRQVAIPRLQRLGQEHNAIENRRRVLHACTAVSQAFLDLHSYKTAFPSNLLQFIPKIFPVI
jgi:hypothetical protein